MCIRDRFPYLLLSGDVRILAWLLDIQLPYLWRPSSPANGIRCGSTLPSDPPGHIPVSYTHLPDKYHPYLSDGYNQTNKSLSSISGRASNQEQGLSLIHILGLNTTYGTECSNSTIQYTKRTFNPVSYTHLDVYKRQTHSLLN